MRATQIICTITLDTTACSAYAGLGTETQAPEVSPGRGLRLAVWRQPVGLESGVPWAGELNTTAEGTQGKSGPAGETRHHC